MLWKGNKKGRLRGIKRTMNKKHKHKWEHAGITMEENPKDVWVCLNCDSVKEIKRSLNKR